MSERVYGKPSYCPKCNQMEYPDDCCVCDGKNPELKEKLDTELDSFLSLFAKKEQKQKGEPKITQMTNKATVLCDDDHFTNSSVHIRWGGKVTGVSIEIHPQCGRQDFAFFHPDNLHTLIAVLRQAEAELKAEKDKKE